MIPSVLFTPFFRHPENNTDTSASNTNFLHAARLLPGTATGAPR